MDKPFHGPAGKATIEMQLRLFGDGRTFQHLLHEVYPTARAIQLVAQQLVSRANGKTKPTMDAGAEDLLRLLSFRGILYEIGEIGLHLLRIQRIHAARIEYAFGIELFPETLGDPRYRRRKRMKYILAQSLASEQGGMPARAFRNLATADCTAS